MKGQKKLMALVYSEKVVTVTAKELEKFRRRLSRRVLTR
jgi:hypothetical protein